MPGGTAYYFSFPLAGFDLNYLLVTALAKAEHRYVAELEHRNIAVKVQDSEHTVCFENVYEANTDFRTQYVSQKADAFREATLANVEARIFHLGPLLADDFSLSLIAALAAKGRVSMDVQGYLRVVKEGKVFQAEWPEKQKALSYVDILKADETELRTLTGVEDIKSAAALVSDWGVKEVVITNGSQGSMIYSKGVFHSIPAFPPRTLVDATGCGDTYMAGYLYQRIKGADEKQAGRFAAALATLKLESAGPFQGRLEDVDYVLDQYASKA